VFCVCLTPLPWKRVVFMCLEKWQVCEVQCLVCHSSELGRKGESCEGRRTEIRAHSRPSFKGQFSMWVVLTFSIEVQSMEQ
jgi:hypothetical protein